ncbi:MAG TPA: alginate export family protein [Terriglobia bacterium]|nr:alginate export family protein [Terriglobia bacterium]
MIHQRRVKTGIENFARKSLGLLSLGLLCSLPLRAVDTAAPNPNPPAAAGGASSPQASSSQADTGGSGLVAAAAANPDSTASATTTTGAAASEAQARGAGAPPQVSGRSATPPIDADAGWTFASYINSWLPSWLHLSGEFRNREEGRTGYGFTPGNDYATGLFRVRLGLDITPTNWFHAFVEARDAQFVGSTPSNLFSAAKDVFDLNQAYVEFRNGEHGWFSLKTGRQELYFGDERLIARSLWSNASRSFDAVRLTLRSQEYGSVLDVFASSVVKNYPTSFDKVVPGQNFYGVNLALTKVVPKASLEPYVYLKSLPNVTGADKKPGNERLYTTGLRLAGTIPGGFDYRARYSFQSGHLADNSIHASAYYGILGYTLPSRFELRFSLEYNYASGNKAIGSSVTGTFDQLYPTTHQWRRITDLFGEQNIKDLKPGFDFRPVKKMRVYLVYSDLSLASRYDSLYTNSGSTLIKVPKGGALSTKIGNETDIWGTYGVNRRLQIGAGYGRLFAGQFLKQNSMGADSSYPYGFIDYHF